MIEEACESERKRRYAWVSGVWLLRGQEGRADVEAAAVWEKSGREQGIFSGLFGIIEVHPSAGVCVGATLVVHSVREMKAGGGGGLLLGQVWFPLDPRPWLGLFVQAESPKGEQRQPWRDYQLQFFTLSLSFSLSLYPTPPVLIPFSASFSSTPRMEQSPGRSSKLFTDVHCLWRIPVRALLSSKPSHVTDVSFCLPYSS